MAHNRLVFSGLEELKAELRNLPAELTDEAVQIGDETVNGVASTIRGIYSKHRVSGNLVEGVRVLRESSGRFGMRFVVKSTAPHAWLFDNGSVARHYMTIHGKKHSTGRMWGRSAPTHAFVRTAMAARRVMYERLADLLRNKGFEVVGKAA